MNINDKSVILKKICSVFSSENRRHLLCFKWFLITDKPLLTLNSDKSVRILDNLDQIEILVDEGQNLTISCSVDSNPSATKMNFYGNDKLFKNANSALTLEFIGIKKEEQGLYKCVAKNNLGETYKNVTVIVQCKYKLYNGM